MSEHLLKFLLTELKIIRVRCNRCHAVIEIQSQVLAQTFERNVCPACQRMFSPIRLPGGDVHPKELFAALQRAIDLSAQFYDEIAVEFVLPQPPQE